MEMIKVVSSNVRAVGYYDNDLYVDYDSGTYVYYEVPEAIYASLLKAESKGKFMHAEVKGKFKCMLIQEERYVKKRN